MEALRSFVGKYYGESGTRSKMPVNLLEMAVAVYSIYLIADSPRFLITTPLTTLKPTAFELERVINQLARAIDLESTLRAAVLDALFSVGIVKVSFDAPDGQENGAPQATTVHLDDWVHDSAAREFSSIEFCGNKYQLPYDYVMSSGLYKPAAKKDLRPSDDKGINEDGDQRSETLSMGEGQQMDRLEEYVDLWDIWIPRDRQLITVELDTDKPPLRVVEYQGPDSGPYHLLGFQDVPGNVMPLPPVAVWRDLHEATNHVWNKLIRQAQRQKTLGVAGPGAGDDAQRAIDAQDGDVIKIDGQGIQEIRVGGPDQQNMGFGSMLRDLFGYMAGNIDSLGGLGPQADTFGQDKLLAANASKRAEAMQKRVSSFTRAIGHNIAWYVWYDEFMELSVPFDIPRTNLGGTIQWNHASKSGKFVEYNFDIEPYSMVHQSPSDRLQTLSTVLQQFIAPFQQQLQAQGAEIDFEKLLKLVAKYSAFDDLNELLTFTGGPLQGEESMPRQPGKLGANSTRTYERVSRPGRTNRGMAQTMMQLAMGGKPQGSEMAAAMGVTR